MQYKYKRICANNKKILEMFVYKFIFLNKLYSINTEESVQII